MPNSSQFDGADPQDQAETEDETNLDDRETTVEMRTFEELPDLLDLTTAPEDDDLDGPMAADVVPGPDDVEGPRTVRAKGDAREPELDRRLDEGLEETFPASDPVAVTPRRH